MHGVEQNSYNVLTKMDAQIIRLMGLLFTCTQN